MISILHQTKNIISPASISKVLSSLRHEICKLTACQHNRRTTIEVDLQGRSFVATCATNIYHVFLLGKGTFQLLFEYSWPDKKKLRLQRMGIWKDVLPMHDQLFGSFLVRKKLKSTSIFYTNQHQLGVKLLRLSLHSLKQINIFEETNVIFHTINFANKSDAKLQILKLNEMSDHSSACEMFQK